jgi:hypothetical protein
MVRFPILQADASGGGRFPAAQSGTGMPPRLA